MALEGAHNPHLKTIALSCLAPRLKNHPSLCKLYTSLLLGLPDNERVVLLEQPASRIDVIQVGSYCQHEINSIPFNWDSLGIARELAQHIQSNNLETMDMHHFDILNACVATADSNHEADESVQEWTTVFELLQNHLFAGLCDGDLCKVSCQVILKFFKMLRANAIRSMPLLFRSLEVMFHPHGNGASEVCQEVVPLFLISMYDLGEPFTLSLQKLASSMLEQRMDHTPLRDFLIHVQQQQQR